MSDLYIRSNILYSDSVLFEAFNKTVYPMQFIGNVYQLRAVGGTHTAPHTVTCLTELGHTAVISYEKRPTSLMIVLAL